MNSSDVNPYESPPDPKVRRRSAPEGRVELPPFLSAFGPFRHIAALREMPIPWRVQPLMIISWSMMAGMAYGWLAAPWLMTPISSSFAAWVFLRGALARFP
jgi:hypothetical protein